MSAAEKLKVLLNGRAGFPVDQRHVGDADVIAVLPQIVTIVEAAEKFEGIFPYSSTNAQLRRALAALDEALGEKTP